MASALYIRIRPTTPWRIGPDSGDRDRVDRIFHSDTLYAAVTSAMAQLDLLEAWLDNTARYSLPQVRFTSCFPSLRDVLYVPPPRHLWPPPASSKIRWKGARFVPMRVVEDLVAGKTLVEDSWEIDVSSECLIPTNGTGPFRVAVRSSAALDRQGEGVATHSTACLEFAPEGGMWAAAEFATEEARKIWSPLLRAAFRLLADTGLGGERSSGWGRAEISLHERDLPQFPAEGESAWWLLSLFTPSPEDQIDWQQGNYAIVTRGGRVESPAGWGEPKKFHRMLAEGSVVVASSPLTGSATDVSPANFPHPVYRAGYAMALRVPLRAEAKSAE